MSKSKIFIIGLLFWVPFIFSQTTIKGKVVVKEQSAEGIHITNLVSEKATITNENGEFSIQVEEGDLLVFSAVHLNYWRRSISTNDIKNGFIEVGMTPKVSELEEVVLTEYTKINAKELGIINYTPKKLTPAERRLYTATSGGGIIPLDPIINWITGRTKMLKKEIEVEKRERMLEWLNNNFEDESFIHTFKIPFEYVDGFKFYVVEDLDLAQAIQAKNKNRVAFLLGELAQDFLTYLNENGK
jgi:hypothetical protein